MGSNQGEPRRTCCLSRSRPRRGGCAVDPTVGDLYVENYTTDLCRYPLDSSRPLWDLHILAIRTSEAAAGVAVLCLHHSLGDGISLMSLLHACTHQTSDHESFTSLPEARRRPALMAARSKPLMLLCWIWTFLIYALNTFVEVFHLFSIAIFLKDTTTPIMGKEGVEYQPRVFVHRSFCLDDIKAVKNTIGCTINDVMVGVTSAALSRYLSRRYGGLLPKQLRIRTSLMNLTDMMKKDSEVKWGNQFAYFLLRLPVMKCEDPLDYIRKGAAITEKKKKSLAVIFNYTSVSLISKYLGIKVVIAFLHKVLSSTTFTFSNIIGPIEEVSFCG